MGELLIDFISTDKDVSLAASSGFLKNPGGAPANVAAGVAKLGFSSGFIGKVGDDPFGLYLKQVLNEHNVDTSHMLTDPEYRTTLSFVAQRPDGLRDCMFYRNPGADMMLTADEISEDYIKSFKILHFGSVSLGCEPCKQATLAAALYAKKNGLTVSYDPNLRLSLWDSADRAKREINNAFAYADIVKISDEEYEFITDCSTEQSCSEYILQKGPKLVIITTGKDGCYFSNGYDSGTVAGYPVTVVETTGAGDAFVAALLSKFTSRLGSSMPYRADDGFINILRFANAAAALSVTKMGAIPSLPDMLAAQAFLGRQEVESYV